MGKLLGGGAILLALYALYDNQRPGSRLRMTSGGIGAPAVSNATGGSIGAAAVGVAGKVGN